MGVIKLSKEVRKIPGVLRTYPGGSSYYTGKPSKDYDIICLVSREDGILAQGFEKRKDWGNGTVCYRKGKVDLVVIRDVKVYLRWAAAAEYCRANKVSEKDRVVSIFRLITE